MKPSRTRFQEDQSEVPPNIIRERAHDQRAVRQSTSGSSPRDSSCGGREIQYVSHFFAPAPPQEPGLSADPSTEPERLSANMTNRLPAHNQRAAKQSTSGSTPRDSSCAGRDTSSFEHGGEASDRRLFPPGSTCVPGERVVLSVKLPSHPDGRRSPRLPLHMSRSALRQTGRPRWPSCESSSARLPSDLPSSVPKTPSL